MTVRGIVVPLRWTDDGSITAVGISGFDERDVVIGSIDSLDEWFPLLREEVEVTGVVTGEVQGLKTIQVLDCRVVKRGQDGDAL